MAKPGEQDGLEIVEDDLGEAALVKVNTGLYDRAAIFKAAYWATDKAYLYLFSEKESTRVVVEVRPKEVKEGVALQLARDFCNALVDQQTRQMVLAETSSIRDALLRKAFGEGHKHLDPETLV